MTICTDVSTERLESKSLLIVDDDEGFANLLRLVLERHGYTVNVSHCGREALTWLQTHSVSLLVLDNGLPDMKGTDVVDCVKRAGKSIPFVFVTGNGDERLAVQLMKQGALDYIVKDAAILDSFPFALDKVFEQISLSRRLAATESELRQSEAYFRMLVQSISDHAIFRLNKDGVIQGWNAGAEQLTGFASKEIISKKLDVLCAPEDRKPVRELFERAASQTKTEHEGACLRKDGSLFWAQFVVSPVRKNEGSIEGFACVIRDLSARKAADDAIHNANAKLELRVRERTEELERANAQLRETTRQAQEANRAKDLFLATISHELRTPLTPIIGWTRMLREHVLGETDRRKAFEVIERNAKSQAQLVEDLLDVSRIITGKLDLTMTTMELDVLIEQCIDIVRPMAANKQIVFKTIYECRPVVLADEIRLKQVFWNLLTNAIKFSPMTGCISVGVVSEGSNVRIEVKDFGEGIPADAIPHLFEKFWQLDGGSARKHGGLGLGLAIVQHLVELHQGKVSAQSEGAGKGATFIVILPMSPRLVCSESAVDSASSNEVYGLKGIQVLVVEDDRDTRELLSFILRRGGAIVEVAGSVQEAEKSIERTLPDVIISDISMPDEDGYSFIRKLRSSSRTRHVPAIALTAYATQESKAKVLASGFQSHIPKPADSLALQTKIRELVQLKHR